MAERADFDGRFDALAGLAYRVAFRLLGQRDEAEEVAQEALARAFASWRRVASYDEPWVARVATNLAIDVHRRRRPSTELKDDVVVPGDLAARVLERHGLIESLRRLPRRQRQVVVLRYLADLSERQVADLLGTTVGSVKQHCHRAMTRLRLDLEATDV